MVVIRLSRGGSKKRPFYRLTVADSRRARDSKFIERVGFYNPIARGGEESLRVDMERVNHWLGLGARATDRVRSLIKEAGLGEEELAKLMDHRLARRKRRKAAKAQQADKQQQAGDQSKEPQEDAQKADTEKPAAQAAADSDKTDSGTENKQSSKKQKTDEAS